MSGPSAPDLYASRLVIRFYENGSPYLGSLIVLQSLQLRPDVAAVLAALWDRSDRRPAGERLAGLSVHPEAREAIVRRLCDAGLLVEGGFDEEAAWLGRQEQELEPLPFVDQVELTNACPFTCPFCPRGEDDPPPGPPGPGVAQGPGSAGASPEGAQAFRAAPLRRPAAAPRPCGRGAGGGRRGARARAVGQPDPARRRHRALAARGRGRRVDRLDGRPGYAYAARDARPRRRDLRAGRAQRRGADRAGGGDEEAAHGDDLDGGDHLEQAPVGRALRALPAAGDELAHAGGEAPGGLRRRRDRTAGGAAVAAAVRLPLQERLGPLGRVGGRLLPRLRRAHQAGQPAREVARADLALGRAHRFEPDEPCARCRWRPDHYLREDAVADTDAWTPALWPEEPFPPGRERGKP